MVSLGKRWLVIGSVMVLILACLPVWYTLTKTRRASLEPLYVSLPALVQAWHGCTTAPDAATRRPLLAAPWSLTLMSVDSGPARHDATLRLVAERLRPLTEQLGQVFPGLELALQARYHTPLGGNGTAVSPQLLSSLFQVQDWTRDAASRRANVVLVLYFSDVAIPDAYRAFTVGQTAGVVTVVCPGGGCPREDRPSPALVDASAAVFARQIRQLFGLTASGDGGVALSAAELSAVVGLYTASYVSQAVHCLQSLRDIVDRLPNLAVHDRVAATIEQAVRHLDAAIDGDAPACSTPGWASGARLLHAMHSASFAEAAYFDPSLTGALYYPVEHTLTIYGSTFLTAITSVLLAGVREWKHCRAKAAVRRA